MRASCGGITSSSAPGAGFTCPVAAITGRIGPERAAATVTGTASSVSTASGEALWHAERASRSQEEAGQGFHGSGAPSARSRSASAFWYSVPACTAWRRRSCTDCRLWSSATRPVWPER